MPPPFFSIKKMCFSIFRRFSNELALQTLTEQVSTARSPRIMVQIIEIILFDPFYDFVTSLDFFFVHGLLDRPPPPAGGGPPPGPP